ncbi:unnamed protein product [Didymodactylos carnosus]|uniref:Uncharacterized protein n=2 Tax=Didymodactylos carnosus TaxID=1234261 RepID=A0A8S2H114_9BILA|nr:unnamed protein product [Didymodactylos carnosus]CAF3585413.1 unnamed protein product [Didymodactylos carnosus]
MDQNRVGHVIQNAKVALLRDFVHHYLGFQHITRDEVIRNHTRALVKKLLLDGRDGIVLILDGTYINSNLLRGLARYESTLLYSSSNSYINYFKDANDLSDLSSDDSDDDDTLFSLM